MYSDKLVKKRVWLLWVLGLILAVAVLLMFFSGKPGRDLSDSGADAIRAAVQRCALQCYVVEGYTRRICSTWSSILVSRSTTRIFTSHLMRLRQTCRQQYESRKDKKIREFI